jgi:hypothetical protein
MHSERGGGGMDGNGGRINTKYTFQSCSKAYLIENLMRFENRE